MDIPFLANQDHSVNPWFDIFPTCKTSEGCGTQLQNYTLHSARFLENACLILLTFQFVNFNAISTDKLKTMRIPAALNQPRQSQAHSFRRNWHDVTWKLICHEYILYVFFFARGTQLTTAKNISAESVLSQPPVTFMYLQKSPHVFEWLNTHTSSCFSQL